MLTIRADADLRDRSNSSATCLGVTPLQQVSPAGSFITFSRDAIQAGMPKSLPTKKATESWYSIANFRKLLFVVGGGGTSPVVVEKQLRSHGC